MTPTKEKAPPMSPHLYRLLMNAKLTETRQRYHDHRSKHDNGANDAPRGR